MKVSTFRGVWCGLVATVTTGDIVFPAVRQIVGVAIPVSKSPPVPPPAADEVVEEDELTASMAGCSVSDPPSLSQLPNEVLQRVAAYFCVDLCPAGDGSILLPGTKLLEYRLDVLGILATADRAWAIVRNRYDQFASVCLGLSGDPRIFGPAPGVYGRPETLQPLFVQLCNSTSHLLHHPMQRHPRVQLPEKVRLQFRSGAPVRVKPWGAYGEKCASLGSVQEMRNWLEDIFNRYTAVGCFAERERFMKWSSYLQQYAERQTTGTVVKILPRISAGENILGLQSAGRPMSYLVRFPAIALYANGYFDEDATDITTTDINRYAEPPTVEEEEEGDIPVRPGGWRLYRTGATWSLTQGSRAGSSTDQVQGQGAYMEMELEVPFYRLYVDVADAKARNMNPFRADIVAGNQQELGEEAEEELRANPILDEHNRPIAAADEVESDTTIWLSEESNSTPPRSPPLPTLSLRVTPVSSCQHLQLQLHLSNTER